MQLFKASDFKSEVLIIDVPLFNFLSLASLVSNASLSRPFFVVIPVIRVRFPWLSTLLMI